MQLAEAMRRGVEESALPHAASPVAGAVTISLGVAVAPARGSTFQALLASADQSLYLAKDGGRNRVETPP